MGLLAAVAVFIASFVLPRRGVEFSDEGWVLSASLAAARDWQLDLVVPQAPLWALNLVLINLGVKSYLALRWAFCSLISACLGIVLISLESPHRLSGLSAARITVARQQRPALPW